jgi:thiamine monophosphate synthase
VGLIVCSTHLDSMELLNSILNISKFSLISRNWNIEKYALGGIMPQNFRKLKNLDISGLAVRRAFLMNKLDTKFKLFSRNLKKIID